MPYMTNGRMNAEDRVNMDAAAARATRDLVQALFCSEDVPDDFSVRIEVFAPAQPLALYERELCVEDALETIRIEES